MNTIAALVGVLAFSALLAAAPSSSAGTSPSLNVMYTVTLSQSFTLYGSVTHTVDFAVNGTFPSSSLAKTVTVVFRFTYEGIEDLPPGAYSNISEYHPVPSILDSKLVVTFPASVTSYSFDISGAIQGETSFLYRNTAQIPYASVYSSAPPYFPTSYYISIPLEPGAQVFSVTPSSLPKNDVSAGSGQYLVLNPSSDPTSVSIQYQPPLRDYVVFVYLALVSVALVVLPWALRKRLQDVETKRLTYLSRSVVARLTRFTSSLSWQKLFALLVIVGMVMITLAFVFGPSPAPKVYLAATPATTKILVPYVTNAGYSYLTVGQAGDEFDVMSQLGTYTAAVVADYPPPLVSGLGSLLHILVIKEYASPQYISSLQNLYPNQVTIINSPSELTAALSSIPPRTNPLGISIGNHAYKGLLGTEAILTLLVPFIALAFLARFLIESKGSTLVRIGEAVGYSFFCFMFAQLVFMVTSLYLGLPVALHAAISHSETAGGVLGFGAGSRPREVMGALGVVFGVVSGNSGKFKFDRVTIVALIGAAIFLIIDPLKIGISFYEVLMSQTTAVSTASGTQTVLQARSIIGSSMNFFGAAYNVSLTYYAQHGASLFYMGAVPLALYPILKKWSATILVVFVSLDSGLGFIRISDMNPTKSIASVIPGVALGVAVVVIFLVANLFEGSLRKRVLQRP